MLSLEELCRKTCEIARESGKIMADQRQTFDNSRIISKGMHDLVSYVDQESEKRIVSQLQQLLPESGFIAEEGTVDIKGENYNWIIDPLDGTTNYIQGVPIYCVSIGLLRNDELVLGVVYEVGRDECFYAWKGGGAYLNGESIHVSTRADIHDALLATGFPYSDFSRMDEYMEFLKWAMQHARGVRRLGSAAADLVYVACGRFDAFWEYDLKPWDVAGGALIVQEAGGTITDYSGGNNFLFGKEIIASNVVLDELLLQKIRDFSKM